MVLVNAIAFWTGSLPVACNEAVRNFAASVGFGAGAGRAPGRAVARCVTLLV